MDQGGALSLFRCSFQFPVPSFQVIPGSQFFRAREPEPEPASPRPAEPETHELSSAGMINGCYIPAMVVDVAGIPVQLSATDAPLRALLLDRYRNFLTPGAAPAVRLDVEVVDECLAIPDLAVQARGAFWRIVRGDFEAEWDSATGMGRIRQTRNPYSTDSVLRILHSVLLAGEHGFLLHASSLVLDGRAYVFTGPSGAGKTTIARFAPAHAVLLTDEISCVRQASGEWRAYGTPFAGELGLSGERVSAPVAAIYELVQGRENRIDPLTSGSAVRALMKNVLFFTRDAGREERVLDTVCELVAARPVARLTFTRDAAAWLAIAS